MTTVIWKSDKDPGFPRSGDKKRMLVESLSWQVRVQSHVWSPPTDVYETDSAYIVRVEVAGMRQQDFEINLQDDYLIIRGTRPDVPERRAYHQMEIRFGEFSSIISIPEAIDSEHAEAEYDDGFLFVVLPKSES